MAAVYAAVAARQLTGRGPAVWILFGLGSIGTLLLGLLSPRGAVAALSQAAPVILFLFALFLFVGELDRAGAIRHVARWLAARTPHARDLPFVLFVGFGLASAVLVNDALVVIGAPLFLAMAGELGIPRKPMLLVLAFSVSVGSVLTPIGSPQNLLVALASGLRDPAGTFLRFLLVPTLLNLVLGGLFLRWIDRDAFAQGAERHRLVHAHPPRLLPAGGWGRRIVAHPSLVVFPATVLLLFGTSLAASVTSFPVVPVDEIALAGAILLLLLSPRRIALLRGVDYSILVLFAGLFVVVGGAAESGVAGAIESLVRLPGPGHPLGAIPLEILVTLGGVQLFSNVPWVALQISALHGLGYGAGTPAMWVALAAGSTLAGNLTLLGAASNLIVVGAAEDAGVSLRLGEFVRRGLPLTLMTITVLWACLAVGI